MSVNEPLYTFARAFADQGTKNIIPDSNNEANIIASTTGALNYIATESTGHYFRIGNNTASTSITTNESETAILYRFRCRCKYFSFCSIQF